MIPPNRALDKDTINEMDELCDRLRADAGCMDDDTGREILTMQLESFARMFTNINQTMSFRNYHIYTWDTTKKVVGRVQIVMNAYNISFNDFRDKYCRIGMPLQNAAGDNRYVLAPCNTDMGWARDVARAFHKQFQFEGGCDESPTIPQQAPEIHKVKEKPEDLYE